MKYFGKWSSVQGIRDDFEIPDDAQLLDDEIIFARYVAEGYEGDAVVIFRRDGKLYEAHGSHCSCFGLEQQWDPEETTVEALRIREPDSDYPAEWTRMLDAL